MKELILLPNERIDDLGIRSLNIIQNKEGFCFGVDAVLLANFMKVKRNYIGADLGTGTGIIPLIVLGKSLVRKMYAFEIQKDVADMASRSFQLNRMQDRAQVICDDLKNACDYIEPGTLDFVVSNPPYMKLQGVQNPNEKKRISRHEVMCTLEDVFVATNCLLRDQGTFYLVHRPNRLCDIFELCRKYELEPKEMRFVHPYVEKAPNLVLLRMVKHGKPDLKLLPPLYLYDENRSRTLELEGIYCREELEEE